jgi:hypothetical protein
MAGFFDQDANTGEMNCLLGRGIYNWVEFQSAERLDHLWQTTVVGADAAVLPEEWIFQNWLLKGDATKAVPEPSLSQSQIAALTIQSDQLLFLENLSEDEIAFIRRADRLAEMRVLLSIDHATCRNRMNIAPKIAEAAAPRFVETLASYKEELAKIVQNLSANRAMKVVRKAKPESLESGLTGATGALGLIVAPPWSFLLTAIGILIGGQSIRGIASAVSEEIDRELTTERLLRSSPLSVCLAVQSRTKPN